jgi:hypothetical protein
MAQMALMHLLKKIIHSQVFGSIPSIPLALVTALTLVFSRPGLTGNRWKNVCSGETFAADYPLWVMGGLDKRQPQKTFNKG